MNFSHILKFEILECDSEALGFSFGWFPAVRLENNGVRQPWRRKAAMVSSPAKLEVRPAASDSSRSEWRPAR
jgi:hypothetical protein